MATTPEPGPKNTNHALKLDWLPKACRLVLISALLSGAACSPCESRYSEEVRNDTRQGALPKSKTDWKVRKVTINGREISLGMTFTEVTEALGKPNEVTGDKNDPNLFVVDYYDGCYYYLYFSKNPDKLYFIYINGGF